MTVPIEFPTYEKPELSARLCKRYAKEISTLMGRCFEITMTTAHDVFFEFSAHVQLITIAVHTDGYRSEGDNQVDLESYIQAGKHHDKQITKWFKDTNKYLDELTQ
ncbi:hypothetical protein [Vibrio splendidus]|uniref:hypothetical protein n=1 Tax=Vibrio splendidus TaxID=29497 RepID=UPI000D38C2FA|nr:hypothetical protein [Vibrio splendidus]PTO69295.1 hypothetical protein CWN81_18025 [Vibrio splendidus]PTO77590.1 hypothetical protein CWN84_10350 [Vibrio splendidus]